MLYLTYFAFFQPVSSGCPASESTDVVQEIQLIEPVSIKKEPSSRIVKEGATGRFGGSRKSGRGPSKWSRAQVELPVTRSRGKKGTI